MDIYLTADCDNGRKIPDHDAATKLRLWIAEAILPTEAFAEPSPFSMSQPRSTLRLPQTDIPCITEEKATLTADELAKFHAMSISGILLLARLQDIEPLSGNEHVVAILNCLASFTDLSDPWTCPKSSDCACSLLKNYAAFENPSTAFTGLLQERIKPLFAEAKNPAITQQGRRAINPIHSSATAHIDLDSEAKPWKYRDAYSVTVFQWVLKQLDVRTIINSFSNASSG